MLTQVMTPTKIQERFAEHEDHIDVETYLHAVEYVRDDGRH
jgi:hypothetical protein